MYHVSKTMHKWESGTSGCINFDGDGVSRPVFIEGFVAMLMERKVCVSGPR